MTPDLHAALLIGAQGMGALFIVMIIIMISVFILKKIFDWHKKEGA